MHLLLAQKGSINECDEAVDLGQTPGDVIFLSAADTEISGFAAAAEILLQRNMTLRTANLMQLFHPMSVDVYCDRTVAKSGIVIARVLGGESYWAYGLEKLHSVTQENDIKLVVLPGDDKPDPGLLRYCTIDQAHCNVIWEYLNQGGGDNIARLLAYCAFLAGKAEKPAPAQPLLKAGIWYPGLGVCSLAQVQDQWVDGARVVAINFYRALVQSGSLLAVEAMIKSLRQRKLNALPIFISSLKDPVSVATLREIFSHLKPDLVLNTTGFAVSSPGEKFCGTVLDECGAVVLQMILASGSRENWLESNQGLSARDLAMNVALPEIDGRILARAVAFKDASFFDENVQANIVCHRPDTGRINYVADLANNWIRLRRKKSGERNIALVMANYPNRDGRLGNGVGLDTPAACVNVVHSLEGAGYHVKEFPDSGDDLIAQLQSGVTNATTHKREIRETISVNDYNAFFSSLPDQIQDEVTRRWGKPESDPFFLADRVEFALPVIKFGNIVVAIQPARGYNIDPKETYHSPDLVPPHGYFAFYAWLRNHFEADAIIHLGKHGNLEWLPGKALSLSQSCYPEAIFGPMPHLYPFIVNDPGEGAQAKRRNAAVIIDHLTPPLTRAESYGPLRDLEALVDEYYEASGHDPRRLALLRVQILDLISDAGLDVDAGISSGDGEDEKLEKLDAYLCELKEMQIRDGLHVFGISPKDGLRDELVSALVRVPRGVGEGRDQSLQRAIALDLKLEFDPLDCEMGKAWLEDRPALLDDICKDTWRTLGDGVERIEMLASALIRGEVLLPESFSKTAQVMDYIRTQIVPDVDKCGEEEIDGLLRGLGGVFVAPGPSGAPTRGRNDVLPTGRNFYSVDSRSVPTRTAWELGRKSAELLIVRFRQDNGEWPTSFGLSAWGTSNMRTGGDDIAQALALIGVKPVWDNASRRVTGYEIIPLAQLARPRIDVTLRISGFFRDAFPAQIELFDKAVRAVGLLDEPDADNPIAQRMMQERDQLIVQGVDALEASRRAGFRIFGSKPGAYGAGLQALIDEKGWSQRGDLANAYLAWGSYAYGEKEEGLPELKKFTERLNSMEAVIHNQDNREHDLLDSDDYYQFEGGMSAAIEHVSGKRPSVYHNDHSRPQKPVIRALDEEIARVVRARVVNPKWIKGVMRHGYKGAFEMTATVDYLFAFAATTGAVRNHHFDLVYDAYLRDESVAGFLAEKNPAALREMAERFLEALEREMWTPRSNSAKIDLEKIIAAQTL